MTYNFQALLNSNTHDIYLQEAAQALLNAIQNGSSRLQGATDMVGQYVKRAEELKCQGKTLCYKPTLIPQFINWSQST